MKVELFKQFLKLDWRKIILVIVFIFFSTSISGVSINEYPYAPSNFKPITGTYLKEHGFPAKWLTVRYGAGGGQKITSYSNLAIDLIFWYLISCFIVFVWDRIKNKKTN